MQNSKEGDTPQRLTTIMCLHTFDAVVPMIQNCLNNDWVYFLRLCQCLLLWQRNDIAKLHYQTTRCIQIFAILDTIFSQWKTLTHCKSFCLTHSLIISTQAIRSDCHGHVDTVILIAYCMNMEIGCSSCHNLYWSWHSIAPNTFFAALYHQVWCRTKPCKTFFVFAFTVQIIHQIWGLTDMSPGISSLVSERGVMVNTNLRETPTRFCCLFGGICLLWDSHNKHFVSCAIAFVMLIS